MATVSCIILHGCTQRRRPWYKSIVSQETFIALLMQWSTSRPTTCITSSVKGSYIDWSIDQVGLSVRITSSGTSVFSRFALSFWEPTCCLVLFFTDYVFMASSKSLSSTEKENRSFGNERDNFAHFGCHSTWRFSLSSSAMLATSLATHHRWQPHGFNLCMHALSAHAISKQITHNGGL